MVCENKKQNSIKSFVILVILRVLLVGLALVVQKSWQLRIKVMAYSSLTKGCFSLV